MHPTIVRVRLVNPPLDEAGRRRRFPYGDPCPGHEGLSGQDHGAWAGRAMDDVAAEDPEGLRRWMTDTAYAPPGGGESVEALIARVGAHLGALAPGTHRAVVGQGVVRAAVVWALELPPAAFWRLDVRPESVTALTGRSGRWNLLVGQLEEATEGESPEGESPEGASA
ncbi:histidine phosphatase family protein [Streptomyces sp. NBC_01298]|uniref:histidine phosphatase family protein n=1 Tax=Streptomyces sp. NBC_01298 TaxID=2903817 RepID=UPI002E13023D|nr:histidine phosphatase family protein [Streptomyces sp. NBC_01298]